MSEDFDLFVDTKMTSRQLAESVRRSLGGDLSKAADTDDWCVSFMQIGYPGYLNVFIRPSYEPAYETGEEHLLRDFTVELAIEYGPTEAQRELALVFTRLFAQRMHLRAVLLDGFTWVLAAYDPERGYREFPPGTVEETRPYESLWSDIPR
jgi:hypothetical protein